MAKTKAPETQTEDKPETKPVKIPTLKLTFIWNGFSPDHRQYKPSNPNITCSYPVVIEVPLTLDLIANSMKIVSQQLVAGQDNDNPILTPLGMRYCIDQFEAVMSNTMQEKEDTKPTEDTSDWDDGEETDQPSKKAAKEDKKSEKWEDFDEEDKSTKKDEKWDETWEN